MNDCPFCAIIAGNARATVLKRWRDVIALAPRGPVTSGHTLVIPHAHVPDATARPDVTARTMRCAAEYAASVGDCNLITSVGQSATQTVRHLGIHIVPRRVADGLALPWTGRT
jgi:histidine triad (HIT) family protein